MLCHREGNCLVLSNTVLLKCNAVLFLASRGIRGKGELSNGS